MAGEHAPPHPRASAVIKGAMELGRAACGDGLFGDPCNPDNSVISAS
jgi:hypothetical protein